MAAFDFTTHMLPSGEVSGGPGHPFERIVMRPTFKSFSNPMATLRKRKSKIKCVS
jgi:hypothetical protein